MNYKLLILAKRDNRDQNLRIVLLQRKPQFFFSHIFVCKMEPPFAEKFRSICMKLKRRFLASQQTDALQFNRLTLLANIFSLQFTEISEYQLSSGYRASKSLFFPYIHCKFCRVCPTTKMTSATVKPFNLH